MWERIQPTLHFTICVTNFPCLHNAQMHGSKFLYKCTHSPIKFVFIDHNFCVGRGICLFQAPFCAYATVINETPGEFPPFPGSVSLTFPPFLVCLGTPFYAFPFRNAHCPPLVKAFDLFPQICGSPTLSSGWLCYCIGDLSLCYAKSFSCQVVCRCSPSNLLFPLK